MEEGGQEGHLFWGNAGSGGRSKRNYSAQPDLIRPPSKRRETDAKAPMPLIISERGWLTYVYGRGRLDSPEAALYGKFINMRSFYE